MAYSSKPNSEMRTARRPSRTSRHAANNVERMAGVKSVSRPASASAGKSSSKVQKQGFAGPDYGSGHNPVSIGVAKSNIGNGTVRMNPETAEAIRKVGC